MATVSRLLRVLLPFCLATAILFGTTEILLRAARGIIPGKIGNALYSVYHTHPTGIYFTDILSGGNFMHANFETTAYWNGYSWHHRTDSFGFRNPPDTMNREILILGDSMLYGHGVDEKDTVVQVLRTEYHWPVYNMARQGDCLVQHYTLLRLYMDQFQPSRVVLFVFWNDLPDLLITRSREQIETIPEMGELDYEALGEAVSNHKPKYTVWEQIRYRMLSVRLLAAIPGWISAKPYPIEIAFEGDHYELATAYYDRVLADLHARTQERGIDLEIVFLEVADESKHMKQARVHELVESVARKHEIPYRTTGQLLWNCPECVLKNDGHLSGKGARRVARFLAEPRP